MSTTSETFTRRVGRARGQHGWTVRALAAKSGVAESTVAKILSRNGEVSLTNAVALAGALGLSVDAMTAPSDCVTCEGIPPPGHTCNSCGTSGAEVAP
jgi:transcriptional regulator with XRE-family HTH domain